MDAAVKISALGLVAALLALLLRKSNPELAGGAAVLAPALELLSAVADTARRARELSGLSPAIYSPLFKCAAVGIICSVSAEACRDSGSAQLASAVETAGAVAALFCALPLMTALLDTVEGLL